jgi:hypothetical protein
MKRLCECKSETPILCAIALLSYVASLTAVFVLGYSLISVTLSTAGQHIGVVYSAHGM